MESKVSSGVIYGLLYRFNLRLELEDNYYCGWVTVVVTINNKQNYDVC